MKLDRIEKEVAMRNWMALLCGSLIALARACLLHCSEFKSFKREVKSRKQKTKKNARGVRTLVGQDPYDSLHIVVIGYGEVKDREVNR